MSVHVLGILQDISAPENAVLGVINFTRAEYCKPHGIELSDTWNYMLNEASATSLFHCSTLRYSCY